MEIYTTDDSFDFSKLVLTKPTQISGGNYFIRCLVNNNPLYIQPPKCKTKQGIIKAGKKHYVDLMFTNENEDFIRWMENLENYCQQFIFKNKDKWFDGDMELHDIENYFTSPIKLYKSGKYYITRVNLNVVLNKPIFKIYDENENEIDMEKIIDNTNAITIVEIQGIKCSSRSFQIEIDLKQMLVLQPTNIFEKCVIKSGVTKPVRSDTNIALAQLNVFNEIDVGDDADKIMISHDNNDLPIDAMDSSNDKDNLENFENTLVTVEPLEPVDPLETVETVETVEEQKDASDNIVPLAAVIEILEDPDLSMKNDIEEIELHLEELNESESIQLKKRDDVYYEMYREARKKAKIARDLALSSYLEAKRIKNTYMLTDIEDSDDSDLENDYDDEENENEESNI